MKQRFGRSKASSQSDSACLGVLLGGHGFAGQGRLIDEQVLGFEQTQIGGDHISGGKPHHVARHEAIHRNLGERVIRLIRAAPNARGGVNHGAQLGCGLIRPVFLDEGGRDRQYHHGGDHDGGADVARGNRRRPPGSAATRSTDCGHGSRALQQSSPCARARRDSVRISSAVWRPRRRTGLPVPIQVSRRRREAEVGSLWPADHCWLPNSAPTRWDFLVGLEKTSINRRGVLTSNTKCLPGFKRHPPNYQPSLSKYWKKIVSMLNQKKPSDALRWSAPNVIITGFLQGLAADQIPVLPVSRKAGVQAGVCADTAS